MSGLVLGQVRVRYEYHEAAHGMPSLLINGAPVALIEGCMSLYQFAVLVTLHPTLLTRNQTFHLRNSPLPLMSAESINMSLTTLNTDGIWANAFNLDSRSN